MNKGATIGLILGLGALGIAAFIFLRNKPAERADPLSNVLDAAPGAIEKAGTVVNSIHSTTANVIKSGIGLATTPVRTVLTSGAGIVKDTIKSLKFW